MPLLTTTGSAAAITTPLAKTTTENVTYQFIMFLLLIYILKRAVCDAAVANYKIGVYMIFTVVQTRYFVL